jgi:O-antigen/teichoic acid export membrane protein
MSRFYADANARDGAEAVSIELSARLTRATPFALAVLLAMMLLTVEAQEIGQVTAMVAAGALLVGDAFRSANIGLLIQQRRHQLVAFWTVMDAALKLATAITLILLQVNALLALVLGYGIGCLLANALTLFYVRMHNSPLPVHVTTNFAAAVDSQALNRYMRPMYPLAAVSWLGSLGDRTWIPALTSQSALGIYAAASGLISKPFLICSSVFLQVARPLIFEAATRKDLPSLRSIVNRTVAITVCTLATGIFICMIFSDLLASYLLQKQFVWAFRIYTIPSRWHSGIVDRYCNRKRLPLRLAHCRQSTLQVNLE